MNNSTQQNLPPVILVDTWLYLAHPYSYELHDARMRAIEDIEYYFGSIKQARNYVGKEEYEANVA